MDIHAPQALLGGLSASAFMRRHWQKQPLLVRQALDTLPEGITRRSVFALAELDDVESRLVVRDGRRWRTRHGPLSRHARPPVSQPHWTVLVQGLDLHLDEAARLLSRFRFVPDARLDDLMVSWASDGGGVGPHVDSYDVFLIQLQGRRRWRIGRAADATFVEGLPLRILKRFDVEQEWVLEPGDLLYLPPRWGHEGVAQGECLTASVGFRAPSAQGLARELLQRLADEEALDDRLYRDPAQPATATPAAVPEALQHFARRVVQRALAQPQALARALGECLSEPKPQVWFEAAGPRPPDCGVVLDARTRMLHDPRHIFINGESYRAAGRDARLMRQLADERRLGPRELGVLSAQALSLLNEWVEAGWLHPEDPPPPTRRSRP